MTIAQRQTTINQALDARGSELRMQSITVRNAIKAMSLMEMLEWYGSDIAAGQSPAGFKTTVEAIKRWHELQESK